MDSEERRKLKEGFLVKKGHKRHNWKTRWFILYEESLEYFKKKDQVMAVAGEIPLKGCYLVSPCTEYTKKEGVFRLTTVQGVEYLIQAANSEEQEEWTTAIGNAIRRLDVKNKVSESQLSGSTFSRPDVHIQFSPTQISAAPSILIRNLDCQWLLSTYPSEEIVEAMQDADAGIPLDTHYCQTENKSYKLCFTGIQVIDWLLKWSFISNRESGVNLACVLLEAAHFQPVGITSIMSFKRKTELDSSTLFLDDTDALYRFSALRLSGNEGLELEWSDDSSDSDEEIPRDQCGAIKGTVVKQGFLQKKGHVRHNWKTRKFILCTEPTMLFYCRPTKASVPVGHIKLDNSEVKILRSDEDVGNGTECEQGKKKLAGEYLFLLRTRKGIKYILRAASEEDRMDWVQSLQNVYGLTN